jgi:hypothetical protein
MALIVTIIELDYQSLVILGQILTREILGEDFSNGACLYHPTFAIAAVGVLASPLAAAALALNTPLVILPRS